jgi:hypothetical protein
MKQSNKLSLGEEIVMWSTIVVIASIVFLLFLGGAEPTTWDEDGLDDHYYRMNTYIIPIAKVVASIGCAAVLLIIIVNIIKFFKK